MRRFRSDSMKNQGVWVTRITALVLCLFVCVFMGYHVLRALAEPIATATAVLLPTEETATFSGVVVRDDVRLDMPDGVIDLQVGEGERVSRGQVLAVTYADAGTKLIYQQLRALERSRDRLETVRSSEVSVMSAVSMDKLIRQQIVQVAGDVGKGDLRAADASGEQMKALLFQREYAFGNIQNLDGAIARLDEEIALFESDVSDVTQSMHAPEAGLFSTQVDGLESVWTPAGLAELTTQDAVEKMKVGGQTLSGNTGKLVFGMEWYLVTVLDEEVADALKQSAFIRLGLPLELTMRVAYMSAPVEGKRAVTFASKGALADVAGLRVADGEIVLAENKGLRVPKEGMRVDEDGNSYVYCVVMTQVVKKKVDVIAEVQRENYFLVKYDPGKGLQPGDEIITVGKDLYDGKIIR